MALEEQIVAWSRERPAWQREIMRRVAAGAVLSDVDYVRLIKVITEETPIPEPAFGLEQLPQTQADASSVGLLEIREPDHVNALESKEPLTIGAQGVTIVYGDNGSGKSGYARLLKRITRARHQEDVLTDVFRDTSLAKPSAVLVVRVGDAEQPINWPDAAPPELQRMRFYDVDCGQAYISAESDFPYRPSALFVMDGLIDACVEIRQRLDAKLAENAASAKKMPAIPAEARETEAGRILASLGGSTQLTDVDALIAKSNGTRETIEELKLQEARLLAADTSREQQQLVRQAEKAEALRHHVDALNAALSNEALATLTRHREEMATLDAAAAVLASAFDSEPVPGVGSAAWRALWDAARRFSEEYAYPEQSFPAAQAGHHCVLCLQALEAAAQERFARLDRFVKEDIQVQLQDARGRYDRHVQSLNSLTVVPPVVASGLKDLEPTQGALVAETRDLLARYEAALVQLRSELAGGAQPSSLDVSGEATIARLADSARMARATATELESPEGVQRQREAVACRRAELELIEQIKSARQDIGDEIARLRQREALESAKSAAATTGITKKILELSEESITEVVRDTFTRETDKLRLERVTLARTRADKGALLHQPKLVGARQQVTLPRVFSEGEQTALGLAAFFTEAHLDSSKSALILDDPVTSLDHIRRGLVAARLVALAETRQVIVFTHDVSFVADLKREANGNSVPVTERSVMRSRADERKPGLCSSTHPWKAKDVAARLNELRQDLARIKRESAGWSEAGYENAVGGWSGNLSETWERIFSQEIVGPVLGEGGLEVRPLMVKILAKFTEADYTEFDASYRRVSQWAKRHDKSALVNYVAPEIADLEAELARVDTWFKRVRGYKA